MKKLILVGAGGHAKSLIDLVESNDDFKIIGLIGNSDEVGKTILGYEVLGDDSILKLVRKDCANALIAVGHILDCKKRKFLANHLSSLGFKFPIISSRFSYISKHCIIGEGTTVGHGVVINANVSIGKHCIINSQSLLEHDSNIEDFCHISTGVLINGGVNIGEESFIGSNTIIRENIKITPKTSISAGKRIMAWPQKKL